MRQCLASVGLAVSLMGGIPRVAHAAEGEWRFGVAGGGVMSTRTSLGPSLQLSAAYQLLSSVELSLSALGFTAQREREDSSLRICPLGLMPSVTYQLDIVRFIPYLGVGVGYSVDALDTSNNGGVVAPVLGVDYLLTREWRVGVQYRPSWYLSLELPTPTHQALMRVQLGSGW